MCPSLIPLRVHARPYRWVVHFVLLDVLLVLACILTLAHALSASTLSMFARGLSAVIRLRIVQRFTRTRCLLFRLY